MRRIIMLLTVAAMFSTMLLVVGASPVLASHRSAVQFIEVDEDEDVDCEEFGHGRDEVVICFIEEDDDEDDHHVWFAVKRHWR